MKKTKMKIMSLLLSMVLFLFVPFLNLQAAADHPARLVDQAELLTAEEQQQIQAKLDEVSELHHCDAVQPEHRWKLQGSSGKRDRCTWR